MKSIAAAFRILLMLLAVLLLFSGCGGRDRQPDDITEPSGDAPDAAREAAYLSASALLEQAEKSRSYTDYLSAFELYASVEDYRDAREMAEKCCGGYLGSYFGDRKYLNTFGQVRLDDKALEPLRIMRGYGAADDFALLVESLLAGDYKGICSAAYDPSFCGEYRTEAGSLLWQYVGTMGQRIADKRFNFRTDLDNMLLAACAADHLAPGTDEASDVYISDAAYESILADCGTNAAGKILVTTIIHPYQYSAAAALVSQTEYRLDFTVMEKLPRESFPSSFAETEYIGL